MVFGLMTVEGVEAFLHFLGLSVVVVGAIDLV